jgi:hypothetical protein
MIGHLAKWAVSKLHVNNNTIERLNGMLRERGKNAKRMKSKQTPFYQEDIIRT